MQHGHDDSSQLQHGKRESVSHQEEVSIMSTSNNNSHVVNDGDTKPPPAAGDDVEKNGGWLFRSVRRSCF